MLGPAKNTATGSQWIMKLSFEGPYYNSEDCFPTAAGSRHAQTYPSLDTHMWKKGKKHVKQGKTGMLHLDSTLVFRGEYQTNKTKKCKDKHTHANYARYAACFSPSHSAHTIRPHCGSSLRPVCIDLLAFKQERRHKGNTCKSTKNQKQEDQLTPKKSRKIER